MMTPGLEETLPCSLGSSPCQVLSGRRDAWSPACRRSFLPLAAAVMTCPSETATAVVANALP